MKPTHILSAILIAAAIHTAGAVLPEYVNPTPGEFPILGWYSIPDSASTPERYREMRQAGFNLSFSHLFNENELTRALNAAEGSGVKLILSVGMIENPEETVCRLKNHPQTAGWFLRDEPTAASFGELATMRDRIHAADSTHLLYLNLLPIIVSPTVLGANDYDEYMQRFLDEVRLPMLSYDMYPVQNNAEGKPVLRQELYSNLEAARRVSQKNGCPFWAFCLSTAHNPYPIPRDPHIRVEAFSALAYGAQCIQYFTYWEPKTETWNFHNAPIDSTGRRTDVYYLIRNINREIQALSPIFLGCKVMEVSHTGQSIPPGTKPLEKLPAPFSGTIGSDGEGLLVSHLKGGDGKEYLMIVNRDIDRSQRIEAPFFGDLSVIAPDGTPRPASPTETIRPGGHLLYLLN